MSAIREQDSIRSIQAFLLKGKKLLEEGRDVNHDAFADEVDAAWVYKSRGKHMKVVGDAIGFYAKDENHRVSDCSRSWRT